MVTALPRAALFSVSFFQIISSRPSSQATRHWPRVKIKDKKIISRSSLPERQAARAINHPLGSINQRNSAHISPSSEFQPPFSSSSPRKEISARRGEKKKLVSITGRLSRQLRYEGVQMTVWHAGICMPQPRVRRTRSPVGWSGVNFRTAE